MNESAYNKGHWGNYRTSGGDSVFAERANAARDALVKAEEQRASAASAAHGIRVVYTELVKAGFSESEAFKLTRDMIAGGGK